LILDDQVQGMQVFNKLDYTLVLTHYSTMCIACITRLYPGTQNNLLPMLSLVIHFSLFIYTYTEAYTREKLSLYVV
jgi:hypothetical protein